MSNILHSKCKVCRLVMLRLSTNYERCKVRKEIIRIMIVKYFERLNLSEIETAILYKQFSQFVMKGSK